MSAQKYVAAQGQQPPAPVNLTQVSAKEFAAKFKSKRECYTFLANECEIYLPPYGKWDPLQKITNFFPQRT